MKFAVDRIWDKDKVILTSMAGKVVQDKGYCILLTKALNRW